MTAEKLRAGEVGASDSVGVPDAAARELRLTSDGKSNYREFEATARWVANVRRDLTLSYDLAFLNGFLWNLVNIAIALWLLLRLHRRAPVLVGA